MSQPNSFFSQLRTALSVKPRQTTRPASEPAVALEPEWHETATGAVSKLVSSAPDLTVVCTQLRSRASTGLTDSPSKLVGIVLSGRVRVTTPFGQQVRSTGESYVLPAETPHQIRALEYSTLLETFLHDPASDSRNQAA